MSGNVRVKKTEVGDVTGFGRHGEEGGHLLGQGLRADLAWSEVRLSELFRYFTF